MIVNVPINVDTDAVEKAVTSDVSKYTKQLVAESIEKVVNQTPTHGYQRKLDEYVRHAFNAVLRDLCSEYIKEHEDEVVDRLVGRLTAITANKKRFKSIPIELTIKTDDMEV